MSITPEIFAALKDKAVQKTLYDAIYSLQKDKYKKDSAAYFQLHLQPTVAELFQSDLAEMEEAQNSTYQSNLKLTPQNTIALFVTFAPEDGVVQDWPKLMMKLIKPRAGALTQVAVIEQRSVNPEEIYGIHCHLLIHLDKDEQSGECSRMARTIVRILEPYKTKTPKFLDIKRVSEDTLASKIDYIYGRKYDKSKLLTVAVDKEWRADMRYPDVWGI